MPLSSPPPALRQALWALAALLVWTLALWRGLDVFGPGTDLNTVSYNSDSAIPVLMANDDRPITVFNFYYYGADRWGGWPFVVCQLINRFSGYHWTPESLTVFQTVWVFAGALAVASLDRDARLLSGLVYLAVVCLRRGHRYLLFEMSQLYGWQVTGMLLGWVGVRRTFDSVLDPGRSHPYGRLAGWTLMTLGATYLAVWISVASAVCLLFVLALRIAVPFEGHHFRTPWTPPLIARATQIVVASPHLPSEPPPAPPATLRQYGNTMKLADPSSYADQAYAFALYVHDQQPSH